jgi:hypothetical protein
MTQTDYTKHLAMLGTLDSVVLALQSRGLQACHECPGYVQIKDCDFVFAPSTSHWLWFQKQGTTWNYLLDECVDAEQIVNSIVGHISA